MDAFLHELLERLLEDSDSYETHIFVVADHGENFGEGGSIGHNKSLTKEQLHVPFLIHSPRVTAGASELATGSIDVAATILALAGISDGARAGRNLLAEKLDRGSVFGMRRSSLGPFEEVHTDGSIHVIDENEFFSVENDRIYTGNASRVSADDGSPVDEHRAAKLKRLFGVFERTLKSGSFDELDDPETREALEALGYVH
jgi:arylsulfatase A-like enzyme